MDIAFSFVVPAYNEENYIGACLESILKEAAGRNDVEVIVADNSSNDHTDGVVAKYPGVKLVRESKRGANATRQAGFLASRGALVAFIDADTIMPPGWLKKVEAEFARDPKLVCVSGPFIYYDLPMHIRMLVRIFYYLDYGIYLFGKTFFGISTTIQGGNYTVRRDAFQKIGGQNVNITFYGDDTDNAIRLSKVGRVKFTLSIPILTSGRRLAAEGAWMMGFRYALNNFWMLIFRRPWTMSSKEIRFGKEGTLYQPERKDREALIATIFFVFVLIAITAIIIAIYLAARAIAKL
ncbi:MAG TPA: glycosyltransferase family A protein [Candidatus Paceibacterota bacterium]|nr:glycosyltransferase family A protein [Candidatus Paceibacterota bacterium]